MQIQYYRAAWNDLKSSPKWFGKLCLLALVGLIPIFGQIVIFGYLYGWAREMAWGVHEPLPAKIFGNEDGKLYRRGWYIFVLVFVLSLVPSIVMGIGSSMQQTVYLNGIADGDGTGLGVSTGFGSLLYFVGIALSLFISVFAWIGYMRIAVYDRLSSGFQFGKMWKMLRHDTNGILRIFGMYLLVNLIVGLVLSIVIVALLILVIFAGVGGLASAGYTAGSFESMTDAQATQVLLLLFSSVGVVGIISLAVGGFACSLASVYVEALVARAMGYWTMQFDVPHWRGQDDPMPFELQQMPPSA